MQIYKELDSFGFFEWYCMQYGGFNYQEYKSVYDGLPLDNIIITELNACIFKWFREKYQLTCWVDKRKDFVKPYNWYIISDESDDTDFLNYDFHYETYEEAELECLKKLIEIIKK